MPLAQLIELIKQSTGCEAVPSDETHLPLDLHLQRLQLPNNDGKAVYLIEDDQLVGLNLAGLGLADNQLAFLKEEGFSSLQSLNLHQNHLRQLFYPAQLSELVYLEISENQDLTEVIFQKAAPKLKRLDISACGLTRLSLPAGFDQLFFLNANYNKNLTEIVFDVSFPNLRYLYLAACDLQRLRFEKSMPQLRYLFANQNRLANLEISKGVYFPKIESLYLKDNQFKEVQRSQIAPFIGTDFKELDLTNNPLPEAILSNIGESPAKDWAFLDRYTKQLEDGVADNHEVKVLILGNGNVGKSCFVSQLVHGKYLESWESSHGIILEENFVGDDTRGTRQLIDPYIYNIWDFAGQDIYHATHRLFMQANALYLILWDQGTENEPFSPPLQEAGEERRYENYSIRYWLHYAEKRGKGSPVILVQTKRDLPDHEVDTLPNIRKEYDSDFLLDIRQVDSKEGDIETNGYSELLFMMNKAVKKIKENETVPLLWEEVQNLIKAKKEDGDNWLSSADFASLAKEYAEPIEILRWLNRSGTVFYQEEYFSDGIILDHIWAIKAIYALFDREKNYHRLIQGNEGQFSGQDLLAFWADYSPFERELFISFLLACEMCFEIDPAEGKTFTERRFIAPQLLPEGTESVTEDFWDGRESLQMHYHHKHFHYGIIQSFIVRTHFMAADIGLGESRGIWKMGIRLKEGNQYAQVEWLQEKLADQDESVRRLVVRVTPNAVPLLSKIRNELTQIMEEQGEASVSVDGINFVDLGDLEAAAEAGDAHVISKTKKVLPIERFSAFVKQSERLEFSSIEEMADGGKGPHRERLMMRKGMFHEGNFDSLPATKVLYISASPDDQALLYCPKMKMRQKVIAR
ncbi:MAG: COR domain-containing protein [Bacteroidota bacterium]